MEERMKIIYKPRLLFSVLGILMVLMIGGTAIAGGLIPRGAPVPADISLTTVDGKTVTMQEVIKGKNSVAIFFNTACSQCLKEVKYVLKKHPDANVLLISIDLGGTKMVNLWFKRFFADYDVNREMIFSDPEFTVPMRFGLSLTPSSALIDKEGKFVDAIAGYKPEDQEKLAEFLK
jgi:cytochrome oxidase Cu insertion factor (SCO1/SenC/PrrC family)